MKRYGIAGLLLVLATLVVCTSSTTTESGGRRELLVSWGNDVILPLYRSFEDGAAVLDTKATELCEAPSVATLEAAQSAWLEARGAWKKTEVFAFGPVTDEPVRAGPLIDFWPARIDTIDEVLANSDALDIEQLGAAQRGLPVIEYLLFPADEGGSTDEATALFSNQPRRCAYLTVLTAALAADATSLRTAWDPDEGDYFGEFTRAGEGSEAFASVQLAVSEVVNRMAFIVENIQRDKLGNPIGNQTGGSPQPDKAESPFSGRSVEDIRDNLRGLELLYFGTGEAGSIGLDVYARQRDSTFTQRMRDRLDEAFAALDKIPTPFSAAAAEPSPTIQLAIDELSGLQRLIQVDIIAALGLNPSFNDNDGD